MTTPRRVPHALMLGETSLSARPGGLNRYFDGLYAALQAQAAGPSAVLLGPARDTRRDVAIAADLRAPLARRLLAYRRQAIRLAAGADMVDAHFAMYAALPILTTPLRRLPLVVHFQGPWADESAVNRGVSAAVPVKCALERRVYRRADRIVVLSDAFGRLVVDRYGVDPARVVVIPPAVDAGRFCPGDRGTARGRVGVNHGDFVVVAARRLERRMGLATLLEAWARVQAAVPEAVLLVAGGGPQRASLEAKRARLPHPGRIRLLGQVADAELVELYRAADCSVVPSTRLEGFGLSVLESMACGTPAIVTDVGGLPEAVDAVDRSLVVPPADPVHLADRLVAAARGALPARAACRAHAEPFRWAEVARRHLGLYSEVVSAAARRPRVVFLDHCAQLSGGELALLRLLTALDVDAHVILAEDGPLVGRLRSAGVAVDVVPMATTVRCLPRRKLRSALAPTVAAATAAGHSVRLAWRLRRLRPDLVHTNSLKAALYGGTAGRMAGVPVVWHLRDRIAADYLPPAGVGLVRTAARILPSAVIANSEATLRSLGSPGVVVPSPVDGMPVTGRACGARRSSDPLRVGMVGRFTPWKGQHVFVDAFASAFPDGAARCVLIGSPLFGAEDEAYASEIRRHIQRSGVADRVELKGQVEDSTEIYRDLDVLVHASVVPEPFGLVVAEGMAAGVAVVAADAGGPAELITDGVDGCLYPPGDVDALAACLRRLGADEEMRARLGRAGQRRAAVLTPSRVAPRVAEVYRDLLETRRPVGSRVSTATEPARCGRRSDGAPPITKGSLPSIARNIWREATSGLAVFGEGRWRFAADVVSYRAMKLRRPRHAGAVRLVTTPRGTRITYRLDRGDIQGIREVWLEECYRFSGAPRTIVDLGSNIGLTTLWLHERWPGASFVCVEPDAANVRILRRNLRANRVDGAVVEAAIGPASGTDAFLPGPESNLGRLQARGPGSIQVAVVTMDHVLGLLGGSADLVKIDIEGGEQALLKDSPPWLDRVGAIVIEVHPPMANIEQLVAALERRGLTYVRHDSQWRGSMDMFLRG